MTILPAENTTFPVTVELAVIGAGACGAIAALSAAQAGIETLVLERDPVPAGSTSLSAGMIPAAGTAIQAAACINDTAELLIADLMGKNKNRADPALVRAVAQISGPTVDWLTQDLGIDLTLVEGFLYPGFSRLRMHAPPRRAGVDLVGDLTSKFSERNVDLICDAHVTGLYADNNGQIYGLRFRRPDGTEETIGCKALILACNGYGGNAQLVAEHIPEMADALYFGHPGNQGDAVLWGTALGAASRHLTGYQGHGSVAHPHGILISWAPMMEGGFQVNQSGRRFSNEHLGYSEQAAEVLRQPAHAAWCIYDEAREAPMAEFADYIQAKASGAIKTADTIEALAETLGLPQDAMRQTVTEVETFISGTAQCPYGRDFTGKAQLRAPYKAVRVTGALFHTQGGLVIDENARVLRDDGSALPNLFAGGGAACGVSGPEPSGYLSGNGLLTATTLGRLAGLAAARQLGRVKPPTER